MRIAGCWKTSTMPLWRMPFTENPISPTLTASFVKLSLRADTAIRYLPFCVSRCVNSYRRPSDGSTLKSGVDDENLIVASEPAFASAYTLS